jgi:class 3 adenylate cyclase/tetratricopeptide (TPR) repeat protein
VVADTAPLPRFGELLRQHRLAAGLTQATLAERAGISVRAVQHLEYVLGQPQRETARRLAEALALSPERRLQFERAAAPSPRPHPPPRRADPRAAPAAPRSPKIAPQHFAAGGRASPPDDPAGERKQVTVLVAEIAGLTESAQHFEPDLADRLLAEALPLLLDVVHTFGGTVNQVGGGQIMVLFGAPVAHEDDAVRACYAALALHEALGRYVDRSADAHDLGLALRVGLDSGEAVIRTGRNDLYGEYTALGPAVRGAARLEHLAVDGVTLLSRETLRLAEGYVRVRPVDPAVAVSLAEPIEAFRLLGAQPASSRFQRTVQARDLTRFVGRDLEVASLALAIERARVGQGQVVGVVGEPGVGKSRLVWEVTRSPHTEGWLVLESGAVSHETATSYRPVIELLKAYSRIEARDAPRVVREKLIGRVLGLDPELGSDLPALLALLDVPVEDAAWEALDPVRRRRRTLDALQRLLLRESQQQPLLLVLEDLHWIDAETQALLDALVESLPAARLLQLVTYRPEYGHAWGRKTYYTQIRIDPLPPDRAGELLDALVGDDAALRPVKQLLIRRAEGNPLFLEESVRALVETGALAGRPGSRHLTRAVESARVPATVQAVLAARVDLLGPTDKRLLQTAAVIGKDVPFGLLQAIVDATEDELQAGLARLQAAELLYPIHVAPEPGHTFKHALTHEVTYGSLLQERRRELHARIVGAIEAIYRDRLDGEVERLAHHAMRGELRKKAVHYLRQAGLKAAARSALPDARTWFEQTLAVLGTLPECRSSLEQAFEVRLELRPVLTQLGDPGGALERLREAEAVAEKLDDDRRRGRVYSFMTNAHFLLGELNDAVTTGTRALEIAGRLGDLRLRIPATTYLVMAHYLRGEYERVVELATDNIAALPADWVSERFGLTAPASVFDRVYLVMSLAHLGRFAEPAAYAAEAIRLAEPTQHPFTVAVAYRAAGTLHLLKGDWARARPLVEHEVAVIRAGNVVLLLPATVACYAWALAELGEASEALARLREGEQVNDQLAARGVFSAGWAYYALGRACLMLGRLDEARRMADRALEFSTQHRGFAAYALHLHGDIATRPDRFDAERGEDRYRAALALAEPRGMRPLQAHCHLGLGKLYRRVGRRDEARAELARAVTMLRDMDMTFWLPEAEREMEESGR